MMQLDLEGRLLLRQVAEVCNLFLIRDIDLNYTRLLPLLFEARARLPTPEAAAAAASRPHAATRVGALVGDLLEIVWVGLNVSRAWYHAISRSLDVAGYMSMAGDAVTRARTLLLRVSKAAAKGLNAALPEPLPWNGLYQLLRPLSFFVAVQEFPGVAAHFDSSFGHSWFPPWRVENRSREMLDHAAYDAVFQRALAELAGGLAEAAPWGEWWPYGGTLLSLMRHGALVGELAEGVWDASVGKDMEIMVGVSSPEEWDTVANKLAALYRTRYRWTCSTHRMFCKEFPGLSDRNDSLICRAPGRIHPCSAHERFCAYRPDFQITGYFRDSAAQAIYVHKAASLAAAWACPRLCGQRRASAGQRG